MHRDIGRRQGALTIPRRLCDRKSRDPPILVTSLAWSFLHYNYSSRIIHNEVIDVEAEYVRKENTRSLEGENAFFSIMADEVTDPHGKQDIISVCLMMLVGCKLKEFFFIIYILRGQRWKL